MTYHYAVADGAWMVELSVLAPASASRLFAEATIAIGEIADEDPVRECPYLAADLDARVGAAMG